MVGLVKRAPLALLLFGLSCATAPRVAGAGPEPQVRLLDGTIVPWTSLRAVEGNTLVVFATPWCQICRQERPDVEAWARAHHDPRRTVYVFSGGELPGVVEEIRAFNVDSTDMAVVVDADGKLADYYAIESTPTLLVLGSQGRVLSTHHRFEAVELN